MHGNLVLSPTVACSPWFSHQEGAYHMHVARRAYHVHACVSLTSTCVTQLTDDCMDN
jgi:hypothetical protein